MALLTSLNEGAPGQDYFMLNGGTPAAPVIVGNPVQLCTGGPGASSSGVANAVNAITAAGSDPATAVLRLGTTAVPQALVLGPGVPVAGITNGTLNARVTLPANASIIAANFGQFVCQSGGQVYLESGGEIDVQPGAQIKFNNASAQRGTFRSVITMPSPVADGATVTLPNPGSIVNGVYAIMVDSPANDGQQGKQVSTVAYWTTLGGWAGGATASSVSAPVILAPTNDRQSMTFTNSSGGALNDLSAIYVMLAGDP
jgi:hypothetical protein